MSWNLGTVRHSGRSERSMHTLLPAYDSPRSRQETVEGAVKWGDRSGEARHSHPRRGRLNGRSAKEFGIENDLAFLVVNDNLDVLVVSKF